MESDNRPSWWFRQVDEIYNGPEPDAVEYLNINTGQTFIHTYGTVYFDYNTSTLNRDKLVRDGITHYRIKPKGYSESTTRYADNERVI